MELSVTNLSKTYSNNVRALQDVQLTIGPGMFGLLGPNGAGKSTLMRTLATLQEPDSGSIRLGDLDVSRDTDRFRRVLGYLPQDFGVYPNTSAERLLDYFAQLKGIADRRARHEHVAALLEMVNLADARHRDVDTYSGGMRQRFGIAQALIGNPILIIVDEPTAGLDPAERNRFHGVLNSIGENTIVLLSTHIVGDVTNLCKRMAIINGGRILVQGAPRDLMELLRGKLWERSIGRDELAAFRERFKVVATRLSEGSLRIVIESDSSPGVGFFVKEPDLEDAYFSLIPESAA